MLQLHAGFQVMAVLLECTLRAKERTFEKWSGVCRLERAEEVHAAACEIQKRARIVIAKLRVQAKTSEVALLRIQVSGFCFCDACCLHPSFPALSPPPLPLSLCIAHCPSVSQCLKPLGLAL